MIINDIFTLIEEAQYYTNNGKMYPFPETPPPVPGVGASNINVNIPSQQLKSGLLKKALISTGVGLAGLGALGYAANTGMIKNPLNALPPGTGASLIPKTIIPNVPRTYTA